MNSATKVGEIFTKAGESFHKMADMTMMLDAKAQELNASNDNKKVSGSKIRLLSVHELYNAVFFQEAKLFQ